MLSEGGPANARKQILLQSQLDCLSRLSEHKGPAPSQPLEVGVEDFISESCLPSELLRAENKSVLFAIESSGPRTMPGTDAVDECYSGGLTLELYSKVRSDKHAGETQAEVCSDEAYVMRQSWCRRRSSTGGFQARKSAVRRKVDVMVATAELSEQHPYPPPPLVATAELSEQHPYPPPPLVATAELSEQHPYPPPPLVATAELSEQHPYPPPPLVATAELSEQHPYPPPPLVATAELSEQHPYPPPPLVATAELSEQHPYPPPPLVATAELSEQHPYPPPPLVATAELSEQHPYPPPPLVTTAELLSLSDRCTFKYEPWPCTHQLGLKRHPPLLEKVPSPSLLSQPSEQAMACPGLGWPRDWTGVGRGLSEPTVENISDAS
ncbi:hypothetical protein TREES_T100020531 [Tupaia chinensis]|uniref:Uncharacterized protein n=1 Tax=Tupaia chinensis TaxID=246437 RepID=L9KVU6_TUPCH|nr:hypothetical protein TREES_T100020531 [Tupaia chinensis]